MSKLEIDYTKESDNRGIHETFVYLTNGEKLEIIVNSTVSRMQLLLNQLSDKIIENIKGKSGFIRNSIMGTRINYSARNVISPAKSGIKFNEIVLINFYIRFK